MIYHVSRAPYNGGQVSDGRDIMRIAHGWWEKLGCPRETLPDFERAVWGLSHPSAMHIHECSQAVVRALVGPCPMGDIDRLF